MPKLNKSKIDKEPFPTAGQTFLRDSELKGFGVRITPGSKTFFIERRVNRKLLRFSIGSFPAWSVDKARTEAMRLMVEMDGGVDPRAKRREDEVRGTTLKQAFDQFLEQRQLKQRTIDEYTRHMDYYFKDWQDKPIREITGDMVCAKHMAIGKSSSGKTQANISMRILSSLMRFAQAEYGEELIPRNPVNKLSQKKQWFRENKRSNTIKRHELAPWMKALLEFKDTDREISANYLIFVLLTGARRTEAATLQWETIDFKERSITFMDTKNHTDRKIPMTGFVKDILKRMKVLSAGSQFVFASAGKFGHLRSPHNTLTKANEAAGKANEAEPISCSIHDLRRTYATLLESLDVSLYAIKTLLGHSMSDDVTASHYTIIDIERLRPAAQKLEDVILRLAGIKESADVVQHPAMHA